MNNYRIIGGSKRLGNLAGILVDLGHNVFVNEDADNCITIIDGDPSNLKDTYSYYEFIDVIFKEFISIGLFNSKTFDLVNRLMMNNASYISKDNFKGYIEDDYFIYEHDLSYDYMLDYTLVTEPSDKILNVINNTTNKNIIFGDKLLKIKDKNNIYFGLESDNDFIIKEIKYLNHYLSFVITSSNFIVGQFMFDIKLKPYMREIVAMIVLYVLEEMDLETLKRKIDNLV